MKKESKIFMYFLYCILLVMAIVILVLEIWNKFLILLIAIWVILTIWSSEINHRKKKYRKQSLNELKKAPVNEVFMEFIPDLIVLWYAIYLFFLLFNSWVNIIYIVFIFIIIYLLKHFSLKLYKFTNKKSKK